MLIYRRATYADTRTRRNRTQLLVNAFAPQLESMTDAYLAFSLASADTDGGLAFNYKTPEDAEIQETQRVVVVDVFCKWFTLHDFCESYLIFRVSFCSS